MSVGLNALTSEEILAPVLSAPIIHVPQDSDEEEQKPPARHVKAEVAERVEAAPAEPEPTPLPLAPALPASDAFLSLLAGLPRAGAERSERSAACKEALRSGLPVLLEGAASRWPAASLWTWDHLAGELGSERLRIRDWRGSKVSEMKVGDLVGRWWPQGCSGGMGPAGCHVWRPFAARGEMMEALGKVPGVREHDPAGAEASRGARALEAKKGMDRYNASRTSLGLGEAGYVARPLRSASLGRHCWLACLRGARMVTPYNPCVPPTVAL